VAPRGKSVIFSQRQPPLRADVHLPPAYGHDEELQGRLLDWGRRLWTSLQGPS
jgi:hypothetical protein